MRGTLAIILAGGRGTRLHPLTRETPKPVLPFAGLYRLVDFVFSNCLNTGIETVLFVARRRSDAVASYIERLRDALPSGSACRVLVAEASEDGAEAEGTAEAVYRMLPLVRRIDPRLVLVLASDHVYRMDYAPMLDMHRSRGAGVTVGTAAVPARDARHYGVLEADARGRIASFVEKPAGPVRRDPDGTVRASMGIYAFDRDVLERVLAVDDLDPGSSHDFGRDVIPSLVRSGRAWAYRFSGYWRDVGTLASYVAAHEELLGSRRSELFGDPLWPLTSAAWPRLRRDLRADRQGSLVCPGSLCEPGSRIRASTISPDARVGEGAELEECVVLDGASVGRGARLRRAIVDIGASVPDDARLDSAPEGGEAVVVVSGRPPQGRAARGQRPATMFATSLPLRAAEMTPPGHRA